MTAGDTCKREKARIGNATAEDNQAPLSQLSQIPVSKIQVFDDLDDLSWHAGNIRIKMLLPEKTSC